MDALSYLTPLDLVAVILTVAAWFAVSWVIEHPPTSRPSVTVLMKRYRRDWMREFVSRDPRIFDGNILGSLREGISFYASACLLAMGGGAALVGNTAPLAVLARDLDAAELPDLVWKLRLVPVLLFLANAFLKFVWAHRLFGYCAIMMAAVPNDPRDPAGISRAMAAAAVNIHAARNFNAGLRAVYFAMGAAGWFAGAWGLIIGILVVASITLRREFISGSRAVLVTDLPPPAAGAISAAPAGGTASEPPARPE